MVALVRHGRTAWNAEQRFLGCTDIPLDEVGQAQALALAQALPRPFDRVYSSPLSRALSTARALTDAPIVVPALRELDQGSLEGLTGAEAFARYPEFFRAWRDDPSAPRCPGGERLEEARERALTALTALARAHAPGELVAAVTHQMVIASVTSAVVGAPLGEWSRYGVANAAMSLLTWDGEAWSAVATSWTPAEHRSV